MQVAAPKHTGKWGRQWHEVEAEGRLQGFDGAKQQSWNATDSAKHRNDKLRCALPASPAAADAPNPTAALLMLPHHSSWHIKPLVSCAVSQQQPPAHLLHQVLLLLLQLLRGEVAVLVPEAVTCAIVTARGQLPAQRTSLRQQQHATADFSSCGHC
jgi:hypothetical protein